MAAASGGSAASPFVDSDGMCNVDDLPRLLQESEAARKANYPYLIKKLEEVRCQKTTATTVGSSNAAAVIPNWL